MVDIPTYGGLPGIGALRETSEKVVWWGREEWNLDLATLVIDSTAVDAGNSPTTNLRAGLLLGQKTSDSNLYQWNPDATDGTEVVAAVLLRDISMLDDEATAEDKYGHVLLAGAVKAADLLIEGTAFTSSTAEHNARRQMAGSGKFIFDDEISSRAAFCGGPIANKEVITDTTVTAADNGTRFVATTADVDFTLPTIEEGLTFEFLRASDHEMAVISAEGDNMIVGNDLSADSVTWTTAGEQIGASARVEGIHVGGTLKWLIHVQVGPFGTGTALLTYGLGT